jgi:hypothetical protein
MAQAGLVQADEYITDPKFSITPHASVDGIVSCMPLSFASDKIFQRAPFPPPWLSALHASISFLNPPLGIDHVNEYTNVLHQNA